MALFTASVVGGITLGATYALITLGLVLAYRATDVLNFAHGYFMVLAAFLCAKWQLQWDAPFWVVAVASLAVVSIVGALLYQFALRKTVGRPHFVAVIATLGFASVADGAMNIIFGAEQYSITIPSLPTGSTELFGAQFGTGALVLTAFTMLLACAVVVLIRYTTLGSKIRAAGQNALLASQGGVNVHRIYLGSWAAAALLGGIAGIAYGSANLVSLSMVELGLLAFPAMLLGGLDSIPGAVLGGLLVGLLQSMVASYIGGEYVSVATYLVLLGVILVIPQGMLGTKRVSRV